MLATRDVNLQFADYFGNPKIAPFLYLLSKRFSEGHICIDLDEIDAEELAEAGFKNPVNPHEITTSILVGNEDEYRPFILWNRKLYMQRYFFYEKLVSDKISTFIQQEKTETNQIKNRLSKSKDLLIKLFPADELNAPDWQLIAAISAVFNKFNIITGGPGTGKTTTVAKILSILASLNPDLKIALAAPTGKAAARMAESLKNTATKDELNFDETTKELFRNLEPSTIHRLLGARPNTIYFKHNHERPIPHDMIIVDESSMIDVALFAKLLDAVKPDAKIIFLGDKNQLASVEAGSLFGDLCSAQPELNLFSRERADSFNSIIPEGKTKLDDSHIADSSHLLFEHIIELRHSYRFAAGGNIGIFSKAIIENEVPILEKFIVHGTEDIAIDSEYDDNILADFSKGYEAYIREPDIKEALKKLNNLRVLCALRDGPQGLYQTNQRIERYLQEQKLIALDATFYEHRPIIITGNNYELGLYNGDIGIVRKDDQGKPRVWFEDSEGKLRGIQPAFVSESETVFAMTIHKSQGSEFDKVLVRLPEFADNPILTRELLYTAVTRAKKDVVVQGNKEVILATCERNVKRGSGIAERFQS